MGFAATGVGCALPGALLPVLLTTWRWTDHQAGWLFFFTATGAALGPFALRSSRQRSIALGYLLSGLAALAWRFSLAPVLFGFFWGLGLGTSMTGISLLSRGLVGNSSLVLLRLNFLWSVGAVLAPLLIHHALHVSSPRGVLLWAAATAAALCVATLALPRSEERAAARLPLRDNHGLQAAHSLRGVPLALILATALAPSIEAAGGAWLATYAERSLHSVRLTLGAPACFWAGLLCSRLLGSLAERFSRSRQHLRFHLLLVVAAACGLVFLSPSVALLAASFLLGFGLGPLYPEFLDMVLTRGDNRTIFFLAGVGSALLPWATGMLSAASASLHVGLLVPLAGSLALLGTGWVSSRRVDAEPAL